MSDADLTPDVTTPGMPLPPAYTIHLWRSRRNWTADMWREAVGPENWPVAEANLDLAHDKAVDVLIESAADALRLRDALMVAQHWHEQLDFDEALNVIDAALATKLPSP